MDALEHKIRFDIALEIVQSVYNDYCHDKTKTREQTYDFCCLVCEMIKFSGTLEKESTK